MFFYFTIILHFEMVCHIKKIHRSLLCWDKIAKNKVIPRLVLSSPWNSSLNEFIQGVGVEQTAALEEKKRKRLMRTVKEETSWGLTSKHLPCMHN